MSALSKYMKKKGKPLPDGDEFEPKGKGEQHAKEGAGKAVFKKKNKLDFKGSYEAGGEPGDDGSSGKKRRPYIDA